LKNWLRARQRAQEGKKYLTKKTDGGGLGEILRHQSKVGGLPDASDKKEKYSWGKIGGKKGMQKGGVTDQRIRGTLK